MRKAAWLRALSLGTTLLCGAAWAQDQPIGDSFAPPSMQRAMPQVNPQGQQSPIALACADTGPGTSSEKRAAACSKLIDSGLWKGKDIAWAYSNRCAVYDRQGMTDKALADCSEAIKLDPDGAVPYQISGDILLKRGEPDEALIQYDAAIGHGARSAGIFVDRGNLLLAKGEVEKAKADFNRALESDPKGVRALVARGVANFASGDLDPAKADLDKAIENAPDGAMAWFNRGAVYFAKGDHAKAAENFRQALKLNPSNGYAALWLFLAGNGGDARAELQANSAKLSQKAWPWPVVQLYLGGKDAPQTLAAAASAGEQCEARLYIGQQLLLKNAVNEALPYLRQAVETCPKDFVEYMQASNELKRLEAAPAAAKAEQAPKTDAPKADAPKPEAATRSQPASKPDHVEKKDEAAPALRN
jgi:tetratricopeptide (TPR) repeat protein